MKEAGASAVTFHAYQEARKEVSIGSNLVDFWLMDIGSFRLRFDPRGLLMVGTCRRMDISRS
jgi:hypothetical protein